ncbi:MAG: hypothetical protein WC217_01690 [Candidatus Paceibacterota bacterium]|jgi:hypothetical protein
MRPVVKVWCLPKLTEEQLLQVHAEIVATAVKIKELGLKNEDHIVVLFPSDSMSYGLGEVINIDVTLVKCPQTASAMARQQGLANALGEMIHKMFPKACVECRIHLFDDDNGYWSTDDL